MKEKGKGNKKRKGKEKREKEMGRKITQKGKRGNGRNHGKR